MLNNEENAIQYAIDASPDHYKIPNCSPLISSTSPQHHCVTILADDDIEGVLLSLQYIIYTVGAEGLLNGRAPEPYCASVLIPLTKGFNNIWWVENKFFQHASQPAERGVTPFNISFPTLQTSHFILDCNGQYIPHPSQTSYPFLNPKELIPPSLTRVHNPLKAPSMFYSSLISAGLLINAYPPLSKGIIGQKRRPNMTQIDLSALWGPTHPFLSLS